MFWVVQRTRKTDSTDSCLPGPTSTRDVFLLASHGISTAEDKFKCPCHGSGYYKSGLNFEGPAPRPMDRFKVEVAEDGQLAVDKSVLYKMEPGVEPDDQHPESVLKI
jgi:cytochrome b6-f complex iron-sulfur subunit